MIPFEKKYHQKQLKDFTSKIDLNKTQDFLKNKDISLEIEGEIFNRLDGYMYKNMRKWANFPILRENNMIWMSITPLEIESHYKPIKHATGDVGVAGLGLGYYIQNILDKKEVESVIVYEINQDIIDLYKLNFGEHDKLTIVNKDILEVEGEEFDFFYNDIYPFLLDEKIANDMRIISSNNNIGMYYFWGLSAFVAFSYLEDKLRFEMGLFPSLWVNAGFSMLNRLNESKFGKLFDKRNCRELYNQLKDIFNKNNNIIKNHNIL